MIVTMTKVAVIGPKADLMELLGLVRRLGVLQLDAEPPGRIEAGQLHDELPTLRLDRETLTSRVYHEELRDKIVQLLGLLPAEPSREPWLNPANVRHSLTEVIDTHLAQTRERGQRLEILHRESRELAHYREFLAAIAALLPEEPVSQSLDHVGVEIKDELALAGLEQLGIKATGGRFELQTTRTASGQLVGVLTTEKEYGEKIRMVLQGQQVYDYVLPSSLAGLPFPEQVATCSRLLAEHEAEISRLDQQLHLFAQRWLGIYRLVLGWLEEQLALLQATAAIHETEMCFVVSGWVPAGELEKLRERVAERFSGRVLVEEKAIQREELERVPTQLYNRGYFQPFELLTRLLPLPGYRSFDLTPIIGIFFPIFFGMMLGDLGYGLLLLFTALALVLRASNLMLRDVGKILGVAAV
ncbi:MAG TPA: V-type ATPase 116kDa subunit family protein, partial [Desulfurivibrionaceae bacterium]|nr:V-type ATPase 116kDa subunit family protein [Desulfurivibrionaceae bacterium]